MLKIGITGGIGSGKSTVCRIFEMIGIPIYDADLRAKWLMVNDRKVIEAIQDAFGKESYLPNGNVNTKYLSANFSNPEKLLLLNSIVHPVVGQDYLQWTEQNHTAKYLLKEAALMFESGSNKLLDKVIVVSAPEEVRIQRVLKRDSHRSLEQLKSIIKRQMPEDEKMRMADFVINNDEKQLVIPQVLDLHKKFLALSGQ